MKILRFCCVTAVLILAGPSEAQDKVAVDKAAIDKAISGCLNFVHSFPAEPGYGMFFKRFDAYYNTATGLVQNNAVTVGDHAALFQFNKCMAQSGFPLGTLK
jgi:hypothetical protein